MLRHSIIACGAALALLTLAATRLLAEDWTQWRGPQQNSLVTGGPALAESWPKDGPRKLWQSAAIAGGADGGFSSVSVAGGRAYLYVNWKTHDAIATRKLPEAELKALTWFAEKPPEALLKALEEARLSEERQKLKQAEIRPWVEKWLADHLRNDPQLDDKLKKKLEPAMQQRLTMGANALSIELLDKLATIKDKDFADQAAMDKWLEEQSIAGKEKAAVVKRVPTTRPRAEDVVLCLDLADGKTVWEKRYPGTVTDWGSSSTPCLSGGRCYVAGAQTLYCFDAKDGAELWKATLKGKEVSSSPLVLGEMVVILGGELAAFNVKDGQPVWAQPKVRGAKSSPIVWRKDGASYLLCQGGKGVQCIDAKSGELRWLAPGSASSTPSVSEDVLVNFSEDKKVGLAAYRISAEKAEPLWNVAEMIDRGTTPIIYQGHVYAVGNNKASCLSLATGEVKWQQKFTCEIATPIIADGKLFAFVEAGKQVLMVRAAPEKYELLAKANLAVASCSSPTIVDGKLYLRHEKFVAGYDLTAGAEKSAAAEKSATAEKTAEPQAEKPVN